MHGSREIILFLLLSSCATARLIGPQPIASQDDGLSRIVAIEPLFEMAEVETSLQTEYARVVTSPWGPGYGPMASSPGFANTNVAITRQVQQKPFFARVPVLAEIHRQVLAEIQRRRPAWRVTSTSGISALSGEISIVRTIVTGNEIAASDRLQKKLAFGFGFLIWPLQILAAQPVQETVRVAGRLEHFSLDATVAQGRLIRYPTQPDYAVQIGNAEARRRNFALDVSYEEGLLANETPRPPVLLNGFVERLAVAMIAIVEAGSGPKE